VGSLVRRGWRSSTTFCFSGIRIRGNCGIEGAEGGGGFWREVVVEDEVGQVSVRRLMKREDK